MTPGVPPSDLSLDPAAEESHHIGEGCDESFLLALVVEHHGPGEVGERARHGERAGDIDARGADE